MSGWRSRRRNLFDREGGGQRRKCRLWMLEDRVRRTRSRDWVVDLVVVVVMMIVVGRLK
jgi:hypothetical protein